MLEQNVQVLITCKINTAFSCCDFYESKIEQRILETIVAQKSIIGRKCKTTNAWALFCFLENRIILLFLGLSTIGIQNSQMRTTSIW